MALNFCTNVAKGLKLKVGKLWGLIPTFIEVTGLKIVREGRMEDEGGGGLHPILNMVNEKCESSPIYYANIS